MTILASYGVWTHEMEETIRPFIECRVVWDLGAGLLSNTHRLLRLGASHVVAVDKERHPTGTFSCPKRVTLIQSYFADLEVPPEGIRVALLSWPVNYHMKGLISILRECNIVIYLGSNTDGSACGWPGLWKHFQGREVLAHIPHRSNSLIVYGNTLQGENRSLVGEEVAATSEFCLSFESAEKAAKSLEES